MRVLEAPPEARLLERRRPAGLPGHVETRFGAVCNPSLLISSVRASYTGNVQKRSLLIGHRDDQLSAHDDRKN